VDNFKCVAVMSKADGKRFALALAATGIPVITRIDAGDPKRMHIAISDLDAASPMPWLVSIRGVPVDPKTCSGEALYKHDVEVAS
jgi:hypothetical protein